MPRKKAAAAVEAEPEKEQTEATADQAEQAAPPVQEGGEEQITDPPPESIPCPGEVSPALAEEAPAPREDADTLPAPALPQNEEAPPAAESKAIAREDPAEKAEEKAARPNKRRAARKKQPDNETEPQSPSSFFTLNVRELDRGLSEEDQQAWNAVYSSYRSKSILTDRVIGIDPIEHRTKDPQTGELRRQELYSLALLHGIVKVVIPEIELWADGEEQPHYLAGALRDAELDYVVTYIDRPHELVVGSRRLALAKRRRMAALARSGRSPGDRVLCRLLAVGPKRVTAEVMGYDVVLSQRELSYTAIADLRDEYRPGQELPAVLKAFEPRAGRIEISVKEAGRNPFVGAETRHPVGSRRKAVISGKYKGGVFCRLPDNTVCLCLYSNGCSDDEFGLKDEVMVYITRYDYERQLIYGRIISKW